MLNNPDASGLHRYKDDKIMNDIDTYINGLEEPRKSSVRQLRRIILETVPDVEETIQYRMPYYTYHGMLCAFASQKNYMSFYLLDGEIVEKNRHLLHWTISNAVCD